MVAKKRKQVKKVMKKAKKVKKVIAKKVVAKKKPAKQITPITLSACSKGYTKSQLYKALADHAGVAKHEVGKVMEGLTRIINNHVMKNGAGLIKLEGLMKIERVHKPAKKARPGINPFTGEEIMFKAKPAHDVIKVRPLKKLKEMV